MSKISIWAQRYKKISTHASAHELFSKKTAENRLSSLNARLSTFIFQLFFVPLHAKFVAYVATIGFFDGVHRGHRFLIDALRRMAAERDMESAVITFEEHPQTVIRGIEQPLLTTFDERTALLQSTGITEIFCFHFELIRDMDAEDFLALLHQRCGVDVLLMGYDHRFGRNLCSITDLQSDEVRLRTGVEVQTMTELPDAGHVSSSAIRRALAIGDIERANTMLGYPYSLEGRVVSGRQIGRQIGFPTANLQVTPSKMLPLPGVYAASVILDDEPDQSRAAILNIGSNPTLNATELTVEIHIPGFDGNLYDHHLRVNLCRFIREEQRFDSLEALRLQIANDLLCL